MLSPEVKDAAAYLQDHAHHLRAVLAIADAVKDIDALDAAAREAQTRKTNAEREMNTALGELEKKRQAIATADTQAANREKRADKHIADAEAQAATTIAEAKRQAERIVATAKQEGQGIKAEAEKEAAAKRDEIATLDAEIATRRTALKQVQQETAATTKKADEARAYLAGLAKAG